MGMSKSQLVEVSSAATTFGVAMTLMKLVTANLFKELKRYARCFLCAYYLI